MHCQSSVFDSFYDIRRGRKRYPEEIILFCISSLFLYFDIFSSEWNTLYLVQQHAYVERIWVNIFGL